MLTDMNVDTQSHGAWRIVTVDGELDLATSESFREALLPPDGTFQVAVDLRDVTFMDSSALGVIVMAMKRARERGGDLVLIGPTGSPRKVLSITALDQVIRIVEDPSALEPVH